MCGEIIHKYSRLQRCGRFLCRLGYSLAVGLLALWLAIALHPATSGRAGPAQISVGISLTTAHGGTLAVSDPHISPVAHPLTMWLHPFWGPIQIRCVLGPGWTEELVTGHLHQINYRLLEANVRHLFTVQLIWTGVLTLVLGAGLMLASRLLRIAAGRLMVAARCRLHRALRLHRLVLRRQLLRPRRLVVRHRRRLHPTLSGIMAGTAVLALLGSLSYGTYNPAAFGQRPTVNGSTADAASWLNRVTLAPALTHGHTPSLPDRSSDAEPHVPLVAARQVKVLRISDVHLLHNGFVLALQWAKQLHVDLVLDTGDTEAGHGYFGQQAEIDLVRPNIAKFPMPYVYVRGNHDSRTFQRALARLPNVRVLDGATTTIDGLTIYGRGDPQETLPFRYKTGTQQACEAASAVPHIQADLNRLKNPPDIVAVHDSHMLEGAPDTAANRAYPGCVTSSNLMGQFPLAVAGHLHHSFAETIDDTYLIHTGTTGADGLDAMSNTKPYQADLLTFTAVDGRMQLSDYEVITEHHQGQSLDPNTIIERRSFTVPWYDQHPAMPPFLAASGTP